MNLFPGTNRLTRRFQGPSEPISPPQLHPTAVEYDRRLENTVLPQRVIPAGVAKYTAFLDRYETHDTAVAFLVDSGILAADQPTHPEYNAFLNEVVGYVRNRVAAKKNPFKIKQKFRAQFEELGYTLNSLE